MNEDMVTVRFALRDAVRKRTHSPEWKFYDGLWMAYFAYQPILWWPEDGPFPLPVNLPKGWKVAWYPATAGDPREKVALRLPRSALARESRVQFEIVDAEVRS